MMGSFAIRLNAFKQIIDELGKTGLEIQISKVANGDSYQFSDSSGNKVYAVLYSKKRDGLQQVVIQGKDTPLTKEVCSRFVNGLTEAYKHSDGNVTNKTGLNTDLDFVSRIGVDESGKGDFFGPLVVGGVFVQSDHVSQMINLGIRDSKKLSDAKIRKLSDSMKEFLLWDTVIIMPQRYNELYDKFRNINKLLAWGHARVIENLLKKVSNSGLSCGMVVLDQFAQSEGRVLNALMSNGRKHKIVQRHKGESDIAVAGASIIARDTFVQSMTKLSEKYSIHIPLGVSPAVKQAREEFIQKYGETRLSEVAKLNFRMK